MGLAILGIVLLLYILLAYFAAKTWQVWHVVLLVFLFIFSFVFLFLASATLKVQQRWRTDYVTATRSLETERQNHQRLTMGSMDGQQPGQLQLRGAVKRMLIDRGRVWRNLRLAELGEGQVLLDATQWDESGCRTASADADGEADLAEDPEADAAQPIAPVAAGTVPLGLDADAVVYAFKEAAIATLGQPLQRLVVSPTVAAEPRREREDDQDDEPDAGQVDDEGSVDASPCKVPIFYMGEYKVVGDPNADLAALTLTPTMPLTDAQIEQLQDPNTTWVLYEVMPVDAHEAFAGMSAEQLSQLISAGTIDPQRYEALIANFARDLQQGNDTDPPERKWMTVRFTQQETIDVDVEVPADAGQQPLSDSLFDPSGRSLVATLSQGGTTQFNQGDEATFDFATAQELINQQKKAEPVRPIYHRRLRDYARAFRSLTADLGELSRQIELAQSDLDKVNESVTQLQSQIAFQTQHGEALNGDVEGLKVERQILDQYAAMVEEKWSELRTELSRLYRSNRQLVSRLASTD
jgi:hypothetical protein